MPFVPPSPFDAPALIAGRAKCSVLTQDGELIERPTSEVSRAIASWGAPLLVHAPATLRLVGAEGRLTGGWFDLLELFVFVSPTASAAPTPRGLALALGLSAPRRMEADFLLTLLNALLQKAERLRESAEGDAMRALLPILIDAGWLWAPELSRILGPPSGSALPNDALRVWRRLPKWEEAAPRPPPSSHPVAPTEARTRLAEMLGPDAETRPAQADFASVATAAFLPREAYGVPRLVLAEAGTGTGKTLGYVAPASLWAERNDGPVWISTYTRHLQRQIEHEVRRLYPDAQSHRRAVVLRKGRENYLCLLNMEDSVNAALSRGETARGALLPLAMIARWAEATRDGDLMGGDLPGWFGEIFGRASVMAVADRRGECVHGACPHYQRCFVEHTIRQARQAELVIANHALVMAQAAWNASASGDVPDEDAPPTRYVFDEGHHLPEAADSAFALTLSGLETAELRRWLLGAEGSRSRARGLARRLEDLVAMIPALEAPLAAVLQAARALPAPGWLARLGGSQAAASDDGAPANPTEGFLRALGQQLDARSASGGTARARNDGFTERECDLHPVEDALGESADALARALRRLVAPLETLIERLHDRLAADSEELDSATRARIEGAIRSLRRRAVHRVLGWVDLLEAVQAPRAPSVLPVHVDFIRRARVGSQHTARGEDHDIGLHRHFLDPTVPFAAVMQGSAHGMLITSATLRDHVDGKSQPEGAAQSRAPTDAAEPAGHDEELAWQAAEYRLGMPHFAAAPRRAGLMSPFDYARQTRAYVITDIPRDDPAALAAAYRDLFLASGGGALGLFTAISRLRAVHARIAAPLEESGLALYAQHVDAMDNATLVDIFRTEIDSCLLGTDAMRDGVDVPGEALRMVVFERTPWPRGDILHRERRQHLSQGAPGAYDDRLARMKLRQAFGRLVRKADDRGVFVMLDRRMPSRLASAFPAGVPLRRLGIADAIADIRDFLGREARTEPSP